MTNLVGPQAAHRSPTQFAQALNPDEIVATRRSQSRVNSKNTNCTGFPYPLDRPVVFVKYGERLHYRESEARTQQFVFEAVENMPLADREGIHVPEVYRVFTVRGSTYIIMEYVPGRTLREIMDEDSDFDKVSSQLYDKILRGIQLLLSIPAPEDAAPGPYGGGIIRHPLFKDYTAAIEYDSVEMLEKHINKVCTSLRFYRPSSSVRSATSRTDCSCCHRYVPYGLKLPPRSSWSESSTFALRIFTRETLCLQHLVTSILSTSNKYHSYPSAS